MRFHRNGKLGLAGRRELVLQIAAGSSIREAAEVFNVSVATAHRWWKRWRQASEAERRSLACLLDRSSRPARSPRQLAPEAERAICDCRRMTGWGPRLVSGATGFCHPTVWKVLRGAGISRAPRAAREPANRYQWPCPGDLLHLDVSEYVRFERPGHRVTGDRRSQDHRPDGVDYVHAIVDDHSRLAYAEILEDARSQTAAGFLERALAFYVSQGISARRLMTDNAWALEPLRVLCRRCNSGRGDRRPLVAFLLRLRVGRGDAEVDRNARLVADDPGVVSGLDASDITWPDLHLGPVVHCDAHPPRQCVEEMRTLATVRFRQRFYVLRPAPSRLECPAHHAAPADVDDLGLPFVHERPRLFRRVQTLYLDACHLHSFFAAR